MSKQFWAGRLVAHRITWRGPWYHRLHRVGVALGLVAVPVFRVSPYVEALTLETEAAIDDWWRALNRPAIEIFANGNARVNDAMYSPVWSASEAEMIDGEPIWSERNQRASYERIRAAGEAQR